MTSRFFSKSRALLLALSVALLVSACASSGGRLVNPGPNPAGQKLSINSEMEWTRASTNRYQLWTIDGELLNLLYLIPYVKEGDYIFLGERQGKRRPEGAYFHRGMRADEIRDLVADGLFGAGFAGVKTTNLRPVDFGGREGLRFDITMANPEGLVYQGYAAAFEHEKGLALALWIAPGEYYYPRDADKVSRMLDTLRWNP
jgi:hypothetical protein